MYIKVKIYEMQLYVFFYHKQSNYGKLSKCDTIKNIQNVENTLLLFLY